MNRLDAYLALERVMLLLDENEDPLAETLRDLMDPLWYQLEDEDRAVLDARDTKELAVDAPNRVNVFKALAMYPELLHRLPLSFLAEQRPSHYAESKGTTNRVQPLDVRDARIPRPLDQSNPWPDAA